MMEVMLLNDVHVHSIWTDLDSLSSLLRALAAGMILRATIVKLLQHRIGMFTSDGTGEIPPAKSHIPTTQQVHIRQHLHLFCLTSLTTGASGCHPQSWACLPADLLPCHHVTYNRVRSGHDWRRLELGCQQ